jgi:outer membrane protein TolC
LALNTSVFVFNGNYLKGLKVGRMFIELAKNQKELTEQEIKTNVTRAYQSVILTKKNIGILDKNIQNVESILKETRAFYENGFVEELDVDRLVLSKENLENEKSKLERLLSVSKNVLKFQMSYPLNEPIEIKDELEKNVDQALVKAIGLDDPIEPELRPEHRLLLEALEMDEADLERIKQGYLPSVYANLGVEGVLLRDKVFDGKEVGVLPNSVFGISTNIPIYDGGDTKSKIERKKIAMEKRQIELDEFNRSLFLQVYNARVDLINAKENLEITKRALSLSEKIYDKTQIKYKNGVGSSIELSQAEGDLYLSQANYINALYDILVAQTSLDIATGEINKK